MSCKDDNSYGHVLKYTGIFGGVQGLGIIAALVRNKAAALLLGPAGMGLASLFNTAANFMSQATSLMPSSGRSGRRKSAGCSPIAILLAVKEAPASVEFSADTGA